MDGEREGREEGLIFFGGVLFAGLLIRKYLIHHSLVSKYRGKKAFFSPVAMRCYTLGVDEEAGERASPISSQANLQFSFFFIVIFFFGCDSKKGTLLTPPPPPPPSPLLPRSSPLPSSLNKTAPFSGCKESPNFARPP